MNVKILAQFVKEFGHKDIDKKFNALVNYKKVYSLERTEKVETDKLLNWNY